MRKLFAFAVSFSLAVFAAAYLLPRRLFLPAAGLCALLVLAGRAFPAGDKRLRARLSALGLVLGFLWCWGYESMFLTPARLLDGQNAPLTAVAADFSKESRWGWSVAVRLTPAGGPELKAILYADGDCPDLAPGDALSCTADLKLLEVAENDYWPAKGVHLAAYADSAPEIVPAERPPLRFWPAYWARALRESIERLFSPGAAGLVTALVTGDKSGLDGALYSALRRAGLAHAVAVSGMHVSMLTMLVLTLTRQKNRRRAAMICIPCVLAFMALTGFSPSVTRAGVMQILLLLGPALGREGDPPTSLSFALLLILAQNPYAARDIGLQLSFAAVTGIFLFMGRLNEWVFSKWKLKKSKKRLRRAYNSAIRFLVGCVTLCLGAITLTTPLSAWYFGAVSLISPLSSLVCLWAVTLAFTIGLPAAVLGVLWLPAGRILAWGAETACRFLLWAVPALARFPFASVRVNFYVAAWLAFVYALFLLYLLWRGEKKRPLLPVCAGTVTLALALLLGARTYGGGLTVSVLDVGQGQSVLISSESRTALVDCGGSGLTDPGDLAADYIQGMGKTGLDLLVLTHFHADHAGGVPRLLERLDVGLLCVPDVEPDDPLRQEILASAAARGVEVRFIRADSTVALGDSQLKLYAPLGDGGANEEGLSVLASRGGFDALMTGDMNAAVEKRLLKYGDLPDIELLVAGHHGSAASTSEELLLAVKPEYAVISVGRNSYGHPAEQTLERLAAAGCKIYRTDFMGTITIQIAEGDYGV